MPAQPVQTQKCSKSGPQAFRFSGIEPRTWEKLLNQDFMAGPPGEEFRLPDNLLFHAVFFSPCRQRPDGLFTLFRFDVKGPEIFTERCQKLVQKQKIFAVSQPERFQFPPGKIKNRCGCPPASRFRVGSCTRTIWLSFVIRRSVSSAVNPVSTANWKDSRVFSTAFSQQPRWLIHSGIFGETDFMVVDIIYFKTFRNIAVPISR